MSKVKTKYLTVAEVAEMAGCAETTVLRWYEHEQYAGKAPKGEPPYHKRGTGKPKVLLHPAVAEEFRRRYSPTPV